LGFRDQRTGLVNFKIVFYLFILLLSDN
jgi:hypothetical protein